MKNYKLAFILFTAAITRIYNVNAPLVGLRSWRQADTMTIAINFYKNGYNILYPQINWGGNTPGYVETEFPLYSYLAALLFNSFGVSELWARLLSIFFSLIAIVFFYLLVLEYTDEKTALWSSAFISIFPLNIYMGRMIMPESMLIMSLIAGCYFFSTWLRHSQWVYFILSAGFVALACLIKIPSLYIGLPLLYLSWLKFGKTIIFQWKLWLFGGIILGLVGTWYYHAHQIYLQSHLTFGIWEYGTDKWGNWGLIATWKYWLTIFIDRLGTTVFAWFAYPIFFIGLFLKRLTPKEKVFDYWLIGIIVYFIIVGKGNFVHDYYQLPFIIPASFFLGKVYARYFRRNNLLIYISLLITFCAFIVTSLYNYNKIYLQNEDTRKSVAYELAQYVRENTEENSLIIAIDNGDPTLLYLSNRKGWHANNGSIALDDPSLNDQIQKGARYLAGRWSCYNESQCAELEKLVNGYEVVFKNRKYFIVRLSN